MQYGHVQQGEYVRSPKIAICPIIQGGFQWWLRLKRGSQRRRPPRRAEQQMDKARHSSRKQKLLFGFSQKFPEISAKISTGIIYRISARAHSGIFTNFLYEFLLEVFLKAQSVLPRVPYEIPSEVPLVISTSNFREAWRIVSPAIFLKSSRGIFSEVLPEISLGVPPGTSFKRFFLVLLFPQSFLVFFLGFTPILQELLLVSSWSFSQDFFQRFSRPFHVVVTGISCSDRPDFFRDFTRIVLGIFSGSRKEYQDLGCSFWIFPNSWSSFRDYPRSFLGIPAGITYEIPYREKSRKICGGIQMNSCANVRKYLLKKSREELRKKT